MLLRPRTRFWLSTLFMFLVAAAAAGFLYVQLGPSCSERLPKAQKAVVCKCSGLEYARINDKSTGQLSSVCFGTVADRYTNFTFWNDRSSLDRSDRVVVEVGIQPLLDSSERRVIQKFGAVFEKFKDGWRPVSKTAAAPTQRFVFSTYSAAPDGSRTIKHDVWFGVGEGFIEMQGGLQRSISPEEKALIQSLAR
jgi:hypothetical protein